MNAFTHTPVLLKTVIDVLAPASGESVLDVTLGLGGHAEALLQAVGKSGTLIGIDADAENLQRAEERLRPFPGKTLFSHGNFFEVTSVVSNPVDIIFADLGMSSPHVDDPRRGFTFRSDAPLDLRYDRSQGQTAAEMISAVSTDDLATILRDFGEVRQWRRLAEVIHRQQPQTTFGLKACVESVCGFRTKAVLPQVFQALRIVVNGEMDALQRLLSEGQHLLKPGGRMGIISYHSLEDRAVKHAFRGMATPVIDELTGQTVSEAPFELLTQKAIKPDEGEMSQNPRARSARFRAIRRRV